MIPLLSLIGSVKGKSLSTFARDLSSAMDLRDKVGTFSKLENIIQEIKIQA